MEYSLRRNCSQSCSDFFINCETRRRSGLWVPIVPVQGSRHSQLGGTHGGVGGVENARLEKVPGPVPVPVPVIVLSADSDATVGLAISRQFHGVKLISVVHFHVIASISTDLPRLAYTLLGLLVNLTVEFQNWLQGGHRECRERERVAHVYSTVAWQRYDRGCPSSSVPGLVS